MKKAENTASQPKHKAKVRVENRKATGFASMDPEMQRAICSKGGSSVPPEKRSFSLDRDLAAAAGSIGGRNVRAKDRSFSRDRDLASRAGQKGGLATWGSKPQLPAGPKKEECVTA